MSDLALIRSALISVYHKDNLDLIVRKLNELSVKIISTGGTHNYILSLGIDAEKVESLTTYPSILGGRVKTLHPKLMGGILARRDDAGDQQEMEQYDIPAVDLVIVDLYPFEDTVKSGAREEDIVEKIDIGGISLIRAAAKNFKDVLVIAHGNQYRELLELLEKGKGETTLEQRRQFAMEAFNVSSHYDTEIFRYFAAEEAPAFKMDIPGAKSLRYGENPHQGGWYYGDFDAMFSQLHGKEISYNNLLDLDAAVRLIDDYDSTTFGILKHNNACGLATRDVLKTAWKDALAGDPVSAFGGVLITNRALDRETAEEINKLFFEVILAPGYDDAALDILKQKKNRIILVRKEVPLSGVQFRSILNGALVQDTDTKTEIASDLKVVTQLAPDDREKEDLVFANKIVKHTKSNAIVLARNKQLIASGVGQTSRVDALKQAIAKAEEFNFSLEGAVMASDAFFPFADSVEIAHQAGIKAVIQPGGSVRDQESVDFCNNNQMVMVFTGIRHFKH